jgi:catechol 2,3-dioxygenase-like lactoylglutathione lyase family enzyme
LGTPDPIILSMSAVSFEGVTPILPVLDLRKAVAHYVGVLGFSLDWPGDGVFASVSRGRAHLFLAERDQGHAGTWAWIGVSDVERLHVDYVAKGAKIRHPPTNHPWAREMQVEDLDGNVLRIGSDRKDGEPDGEWLDMQGVRWRPDGDGGWNRVEG